MPVPYSLKIITPQGIVYEGNVFHTFLPAEDGFVGVLANHAPYLTSSKGGKMAVKESVGLEKDFRVGPGFFEIKSNQAIFLTTTCLDVNK